VENEFAKVTIGLGKCVRCGQNVTYENDKLCVHCKFDDWEKSLKDVDQNEVRKAVLKEYGEK